jgi:hypothetical protein
MVATNFLQGSHQKLDDGMLPIISLQKASRFTIQVLLMHIVKIWQCRDLARNPDCQIQMGQQTLKEKVRMDFDDT